MIVAGCDIGSLTAKAVIMENGKVLSDAFMRAKTRPEDSANEVMQMALDKAGCHGFCIYDVVSQWDHHGRICRHATCDGPIVG